MQAIALFVMFGLLASVVGGIIGSTTESIAAFNQRLEDEQLNVFERTRTVLLGQVVPDNLESPRSGTESNPAVYLCSLKEVRILASCSINAGQLSMLDMWNRPIFGRVQRNEAVDIYHTTPANIYHARVPVTAYVLVSSGADGKLDARLQAQLNSLSAASSADDVTKLRAFREASGAPNGDSLDDIVVVFSDKLTQQATLARMNQSINRVAASAERFYQHKFNSFQGNLGDIYKSTFAGSNVNVTVSDAELSRWQQSAAAAQVKFTSLNDLNDLGVNEERNYLQRTVPLNNRQAFALNMQVPSEQQVNFTISAVAQGSNWQFTSTPVCVPVTISNCTGSCPRRRSINCMTIQGGAI